jgi:hypothetical protein
MSAEERVREYDSAGCVPRTCLIDKEDFANFMVESVRAMTLREKAAALKGTPQEEYLAGKKAKMASGRKQATGGGGAAGGPGNAVCMK